MLKNTNISFIIFNVIKHFIQYLSFFTLKNILAINFNHQPSKNYLNSCHALLFKSKT